MNNIYYISDLKKLDDKQMLTEVHLTESRIYHALQNIPKCTLPSPLSYPSYTYLTPHIYTYICICVLTIAKASLTASRSAANSIYVSPLLQAEIDEMSGALHCEEGDHTTAYSYFLEVGLLCIPPDRSLLK